MLLDKVDRASDAWTIAADEAKDFETVIFQDASRRLSKYKGSQRYGLLSTLLNSMWTQAKLQDRGGADSDLCHYCRRETGTEVHRFFHCP
eukprot:6303493-Amphidinium_carterae.1